jgi:hypothetical protein
MDAQNLKCMKTRDYLLWFLMIVQVAWVRLHHLLI